MDFFTLGFIGAGNMATAIFRGALQQNLLQPSQILLYDTNPDVLANRKETFGVESCASLEELFEKCQLLLLAVKPNVAPKVLSSLPVGEKGLISIVAGLTYEKMRAYTSHTKLRFLRVMPNTPLMVGEGATVFAQPHSLREEEIQFAQRLFETLGCLKTVDERLMSAVTGISGSGPAYGYLFIEALMAAGIRHGLTSDAALELAAQTLLGSAKMVLENQVHPAILRDQVCSPGGTTIEAVAALEESGFRNAIFQAVAACVKRSEEL